MPPTNSRNSRLRLSQLSGLSAGRRRFLQTSAAALSGLVLANCARNLSNAHVDSQSSPSGSPDASASPSASASTVASGDPKTLYVYTWANYTDDQLLKNFQEKTGIRAVVDVFDSNESMLAKMQAGGGSAYSIVYPSDYMVTQMTDLKLLTPLDKDRLKGLDSLRDKWKNPVYDANDAHSVPAVWGTTGLVYDPQKLGTDISGWDYFWEHLDSLKRKITLVNDEREVMGAALKNLGYSYNSTNPDELKAAYSKMVTLKPAIASFITDGWEDQLASGDVLISMAYSVDALNLIQEKPNLKYVIPKIGSSLWTDTMVIPKTAPNPEAAYAWLNFMLEPENNAKLVERLKFATPNEAAYNLLPSGMKEDKRMFPPSDLLEKCEGIAPLPQKVTETYDRYWTQLTST